MLGRIRQADLVRIKHTVCVTLTGIIELQGKGLPPEENIKARGAVSAYSHGRVRSVLLIDRSIVGSVHFKEVSAARKLFTGALTDILKVDGDAVCIVFIYERVFVDDLGILVARIIGICVVKIEAEQIGDYDIIPCSRTVVNALVLCFLGIVSDYRIRRNCRSGYYVDQPVVFFYLINVLRQKSGIAVVFGVLDPINNGEA